MKIREPRMVIIWGPLAVATLLATTPAQAKAIDEATTASTPDLLRPMGGPFPYKPRCTISCGPQKVIATKQVMKMDLVPAAQSAVCVKLWHNLCKTPTKPKA